MFNDAVAFLNQKYGEGTVYAEVKDSYYNMKEVLEPHMHLVNHAADAMGELGIEPKISPIRGGTDGARLSFMGLPCPNLCTGGENFHGKYEYACVQSMEKITELLIRIAEKYANM
jgi:tripeptide aminopeptidase